MRSANPIGRPGTQGGLIKPGAGRRAALVFGTVLGGGLLASTAATQFVAWRLSFHPALGHPLVGTLYAPWSWWSWMHAPWAPRVPQTFTVLTLGGLSLLTLVGLGGIAIAGRAQKPKRHNDVHGTARFAIDESEARESGLLPPKDSDFWPGVYVGAWRRRNGALAYLRHGGPEHVLCLGPLRSGKGVAGVMPTLLSWPYSAVIYDEKGELYEFTSGWRAAGGRNRVLRWEPGGGGNTIAWNPLAEVRIGTDFEFRDASRIAEAIADPDGEGLEGHFDPNAAALLTGVILYVMHREHRNGRVATLADVALALGDPAQPSDQLYKAMVHNTFGPRRTANRQIAVAAQKQLNRDQRERSGTLSTAARMMRLFDDPIVARNTERSDFRLLDLMNGDTPVTLYVVTKAADKLTLRPLVRLFFTMAMNTLTSVDMKKDAQGDPVSPHRHRMLMLIDEFASLKAMPSFEDAMSKCAGYGIKCYLLTQDREQIIQAYGPHESITSHCHVKSLYAPTNLNTQEWISDLLGASTVEVEAITESGSRGSPMRNVSRTYHTVNRPLLTPEEVGRLKAPTKNGDRIVEGGQVLVLVAGRHPMLGEQALYFRDPAFQERVRIDAVPMAPPPAPAASPTPASPSAPAAATTPSDPQPKQAEKLTRLRVLQPSTEATIASVAPVAAPIVKVFDQGKAFSLEQCRRMTAARIFAERDARDHAAE